MSKLTAVERDQIMKDADRLLAAAKKVREQGDELKSKGWPKLAAENYVKADRLDRQARQIHEDLKA